MYVHRNGGNINIQSDGSDTVNKKVLVTFTDLLEASSVETILKSLNVEVALEATMERVFTVEYLFEDEFGLKRKKIPFCVAASSVSCMGGLV